jgi:hypothetical protein
MRDLRKAEKAETPPNGSRWSPTGKARGTSMKYPPTPVGAETLRYASAKASAGYPPVAESAVALTQRHRDDLAAEFAFIHGQSPWSSA